MMKATQSLLLGYTLAVSVAAGAFLAFYDRGPSHSVEKAIRAIDSNNLAALQRYIDFDEFTGQLVEDLANRELAGALPDRDAPKDEARRLLGLPVGDGGIPQAKERLADILENEIYTHILQRRGKKSGMRANDNGFNLFSAAKGWTFDLRNFSIKKNGGDFLVSIPAYPDYLGIRTSIELEIRDIGNHWEISRWANFEEVMAELDERRGDMLATHNAHARAALDDISTSTIRGQIVRRPGLHDGLVQVEEARTFLTNVRVTELAGYVEVVNASTGAVLDRRDYRISDENMEFAKTTVLKFDFEVGFESKKLGNALDNDEELLYRSDITHVAFANGRVVAIHDTFDDIMESADNR